MQDSVETSAGGGQRGPRVIFAAYGTLGAVHPCLAIALALKAKGFSPLLGVSAGHCAKVSGAGLDTFAITPAIEEMGEQVAVELGIPYSEVMRNVLEDQDFMINRVLIDQLEWSITALRDHLEGAVAIVGTHTTLAGPIIAEKFGIPYIELHLQPMALLSADEPPFAKGMEVLTRMPIKPVRMAWNRAWIGLFMRILRRRYAPRVDAVRARIGLAKLKSAPFFQIDIRPLLSLGLWSSSFAPVPSDFTGRLKLTGFPEFDSDSGQVETLDAELQAFLEARSPPLIFTLGSLAVNAPGSFFSASLEAARALGRRAVFLAGKNDVPPAPDTIVREYVAHSLLFPHGAVIIHHGGMGTTAQALRHGIPQLIVPHFLDQPDNGRRIRALGVGDVVEVEDYTGANVAAKLRGLLDDAAVKSRATTIATEILAENGGRYAADLIVAALGETGGTDRLNGI